MDHLETGGKQEVTYSDDMKCSWLFKKREVRGCHSNERSSEVGLNWSLRREARFGWATIMTIASIHWAMYLI